MEFKEITHLYRFNNVEFMYGSRETTAMAYYQNHSTVRIRAMENVPGAEDLYVSYAKDYCSVKEYIVTFYSYYS